MIFFSLQGLPVQVRDHALGMKDDVPKSDVNKEYYTQNVEKEVCVFNNKNTHLHLYSLLPYKKI